MNIFQPWIGSVVPGHDSELERVKAQLFRYLDPLNASTSMHQWFTSCCHKKHPLTNWMLETAIRFWFRSKSRISSTMLGRAVILTTHSMEECEALCSRCLVDAVVYRTLPDLWSANCHCWQFDFPNSGTQHSALSSRKNNAISGLWSEIWHHRSWLFSVDPNLPLFVGLCQVSLKSLTIIQHLWRNWYLWRIKPFSVY